MPQSLSDFPVFKVAAFIKRQPSYSILFVDLPARRVPLVINSSALEIVKWLDGTHTQREILDELARKYSTSHEDLNRLCCEFIGKLVSLGVVGFERRRWERDVCIPVLGTSEVYTPNSFILELTHSCPLRCMHCYLDAADGPMMDYRSAVSLVDEIVDVVGVQGIQLTGGEPLGYPYLVELIEHLEQKHTPVSIATSGYASDAVMAHVLSALSGPMDLVQVSIDGFEGYHNKIRGRKDAFTRALAFIDLAICKGVKVSVATTLISQTEAEIASLCESMRARRVSVLRLGALLQEGRATSSHLGTSWSEGSMRPLIERLKSKFDTDDFRIEALETHDSSTIDHACGAGIKMMVIDPDFNARPCPMLMCKLGNVIDEPLMAVVRKTNTLMKGVSTPCEATCGQCSNFSACRGCIAAALANRDSTSNCPWFEMQEKRIQRLLDVVA